MPADHSTGALLLSCQRTPPQHAVGHHHGAHHLAGSTAHTRCPRDEMPPARPARSQPATPPQLRAYEARPSFGNNNFRNRWNGPFLHLNLNPGFRGWWLVRPGVLAFAYDVLFADLFWPWGHAYPFWDYRYPATSMPDCSGPMATTISGIPGRRNSSPPTSMILSLAAPPLRTYTRAQRSLKRLCLSLPDCEILRVPSSATNARTGVSVTWALVMIAGENGGYR